MEFYQKESNEVLKELNSSQKGLTNKEAATRLKKYGPNLLTKTKKISALKLFLTQFKNFIVGILILAALISFFLGEHVDAVAIGSIVLLNGILGFIQEFKAEKAIEALKKLSTPKAKVRREGTIKEIDATLLVPGDIILIEEGCFIPADARLITQASLSVDESALTGESAPVPKNTDILKKVVQVSSQKNIVFAGTISSRGRAEAVVFSTGFKTELGKIAKELESIEHEQTPLQKQLRFLGNYLTIGILVICLLIFAISFLQTKNILDSFIGAIALAVAAIPEGLPAIITITLALGTRRMLKRNALVRRLHAVETLGATSVICADKTGTITKNEMTVVQLYLDEKLVETSQPLPKTKTLLKLLETSVSCNNAVLNGPSDPTEKALLLLAEKEKFTFHFQRLQEIPFSSEKKFMATIDKTDEGEITHYKGAPEIVLSLCTEILVNGKIKPLHKKEKKQIENVAATMASRALRILAFAYTIKEKTIFIGLTGMLDPPREGVKEAILECKKAGIRTIMITGDHLLTAKAIAAQVGITGKALTGEELNTLSDKKIKEIVEEVTVYARVSPQHKLLILTALQEKGQIVAMTGDGVNDALAIKKANIGIATGSGTDVAKEAADIILSDDNLVSIVSAVREGRGIYNNLKRFIHYLLSCNMAEVLVIFLGLLFGWPVPLLALQILWVNLLTDGFPALALGIDPVNADVMTRPPRPLTSHLIGKKDTLVLLLQGICITLTTLFLYSFYLKKNVALAQTVAFTAIVLAELYIALNYHLGNNSLFSKTLFKNKWLWTALASSLALQFLVVYYLNDIFKTVPLALTDWILILTVSSIVLGVHELSKNIFLQE